MFEATTALENKKENVWHTQKMKRYLLDWTATDDGKMAASAFCGRSEPAK
jgi:hypothetical protein